MPEKVLDYSIIDIITDDFISYAMEVITKRALPDVRDGLKPVQRKILFAMDEMGLASDKPYKKSARIVGDTMGKYHPHGDSSIYEAMVNMAQDHNMRYKLIDGYGNFGTVDDGAAAMRYTEARMAPLAEEMLKYINEDTIDWDLNFDESLKEPTVLPSLVPNLLINGSSGIAVGLACNIPTHNLNEVVDGICAYIKNPEITTKELMKYIKGPDFPTGGIVSPIGLYDCYNNEDDRINYKAMIRGVVKIEQLPNDKSQLVITELPYQVSVNKFIGKASDYIMNRKIQDIEEIRNESDSKGLRIVIEMCKGGNPEKLLEELYQKTDLQINFSYNVNVLVDGKPKTLNLKGMISEFVKHKKEIVRRKTQYELNNAIAKAHILEGLIRAVDIIDEIIATIRKSASPKEAKEKLIKKFSFTDKQAQAILDLKLQRLTNLEINGLKKEHKELVSKIMDLEKILSNEKNILKQLEKELIQIKTKYGDERRTEIRDFDKIEIQMKIEKFTIQVNGKKIKKLSENYSGNVGITLKMDSTQNVLFFTEKGDVYKFGANEIPNELKENVIYMCEQSAYQESKSMVFVTSDGQVKKNAFGEYFDMKDKVQTIKLNDKALVVNAVVESEPMTLTLLTKKGYMIKFDLEDIRQMGKIASGVRGIKLNEGDKVVFSDFLPINMNQKNIIYEINTKNKKIKIELDKIKIQKRDGKGISLIKDENIESVFKIIK